ncbi:MAG: FG-GAP-like repeat-containing protein [Terracidiphilus sp.]
MSRSPRSEAWLRLAAANALIAMCAAHSAHAQQFQNPPLLVTFPDPVAVVAGDWNGDGHQDLVYVTTGQSPALHVLLGNGKGGFTEGTVVQLPAGTCTYEVTMCRLTVGDFNNDGHPDILMPGNFPAGWGFLVLPGNGDGTFGSPIVSILPASNSGGMATYVPYPVAVADFNGDGNLDIAAPDYLEGLIRIYLGDGKGDFTAGNFYYDSYQPYAIYTSDVNHDGNADLIVFNEYGNGAYGNGGAAIWLGDGKGNFALKQTYPTSGGTTFGVRTVADMNLDGNVDVVGADGLGNVLVMTGNPDGSFNAPQIIASGFETGSPFFSSLFASDFTGSGIPDILLTSEEGFDTSVATGKLAYGAVQKRTSGTFATQLAVADFNEDGAPDFAVGVAGGIQLFFGNSSGAFPDSTITPTAVASTFLFAGDFNGDGIADVAAVGADGYMRTYLGSKSSGFQPPVKSSTAVTTSFEYIGNTVGDFDGDGHKDIALSGQILYGNGDGTFTPVTLTNTFPGSNGLVADFNKDGKSDLLSLSGLQSGTGSYTYHYSLVAQLGTAQRTFTTVTTNLPTYTPGEGITTPALLGVGDLNGDGFPDTAVYDPNLQALEIWLGNGDGSFRAGTSLNLNGSAWTPVGTGGQDNAIGVGAIVDVDGDGNADLVFLASEANADSKLMPITVLVIEYGDGKGGFTATQVIPLSHSFGFLTPAKLDSSRLFGIVVGDSNLVSVLRNLGGRQFSNEEFYYAGSMSGLAAADFNGNGLSDLLALRANPEASSSPGALGFTVLMNQAEVGGSGSGISNGSLSVSPATVNYNQAFTLTAALQPSLSGAPLLSGTVSFSALGIALGSAPLNQGSAVLPVPGSTTALLPAGLVEMAASYSGDSYYASSDLLVTEKVLNPVYSTQTALSVSAGGNAITSIQAGDFITLTASVTAPQTVPRGYVAFFDGSSLLGQGEVAAGVATFSTNLLGIGSHSLTAQYLGFTPPDTQLGTNSFLPSTSPAVPFTVTAIATTATLSASSPSTTAGAVLTLTASLSSASGSPIGGVTFFDGNTALGTLTLDSSGSAAFSTASLAVGPHSMTAQYAANGVYSESVTPSAGITVNAASPTLATTTTQVVSVTPLNSAGQSLVTVQVNGVPAQVGNVSLLLDGQLATSAALAADGHAAITLNLNGTGIHSLVASYSGGGPAAPSASPELKTSAYLSGQDFTLQAGQSQYVANIAGSSIAVPLSIGSLGSWNGTVSFLCVSPLPAGYSCSFSPQSVSGSGNTTLTLQQSGSIPAVALMLLPCFWLIRRPRWKSIGRVLALAVAFVSFSGCGGGLSGTSVKTNIVTIQATDGSLVHSVQVGLKISSLQQ